MTPDVRPHPCSDAGVGCGGTCAKRCTGGQACWGHADCARGYCLNNVCVGPTGTGADGDVSFTQSVNMNAHDRISGRSCPQGGDGVGYSVMALTSTTATLGTSPAAGCLRAGDEVLLIDLQAERNYGAHKVGIFETLRVASIAGTVVTFTVAKKGTYGPSPGKTRDKERIWLQRIPNYRNANIQKGAYLRARPWNGIGGGVLFFRASGTVNVFGTITMSARGYHGGPSPTAPKQTGIQAESTGRVGGQWTSANGSGGGGGAGDLRGIAYGAGGGGGGHSVAGKTAVMRGTMLGGGQGGLVLQNPNMTRLFLGHGGGSGGNDDDLTSSPPGGYGGNGGGIVVVVGNKVAVSTSGKITSAGQNGQGDPVGVYCPSSPSTTSCWDWSGPGGGGAGGSIIIAGGTLVLRTNRVAAAGGVGGSGGHYVGGAGSPGAIGIRSTTGSSGTTQPTAITLLAIP